MEPMNAFLSNHRQEFKDFVDNICGISPDRATSAIPPSYATPITVLGRLPGTSREGFPSLPYLIDQARECAGLVELWLDTRNEVDGSFVWSDDLKNFDALCEKLRQRTREALTQAEQAERPSGTMVPKWEELVEQMERRAKTRQQRSASTSPGTPNLQKSSTTVNSSTSSFGDSYFSRYALPQQRSPAFMAAATKSTQNVARSRNDSDQGLDSEDTDTPTSPPISSSAVWDPGVAHRRPSAIKTSNSGLSPHARTPNYEHDLSLNSSTFSLDGPNDRGYAGSAEPLSPFSGPDEPSTGKSLYSLTSPQTHKHKPSRSKPASRDGHPHPPHPLPHSHSHSHRHKHEPRQKSMYRLPSHNSSSHTTADVASPRSTSSRDGNKEKHFHFGDFGSVFRKKAKERGEQLEERGFSRQH